MQTAALQLQPVSSRMSRGIMPSKLNAFIPRVEDAQAVEVEDNITPQVLTGRLPFIEANTKEVTISHLQNDCVVPVFSKDNEITISHPVLLRMYGMQPTGCFLQRT